MQDLNDKITGNSLAAAEWNEPASEIQNAIESAGVTLSGADFFQLTKSISHYVANGSFYTDSGIANAYVLTVVGTNKAPPAYVDGMQVHFVTANASTGSSTVNVNSLGVKNIRLPSGATLIADDISARVSMVFDSGNDWFEVTNAPAKNNFASVVELATQAEALAGTDNQRVITPSTLKDAIDQVLPIGSVIEWSTATPPANFLEMDGAEISRATFSELFAVIGTAWGVGDGSTTFDLRDDRGEFKRGWDNGRGVDSGRSINSNQADEFESHDHVIDLFQSTGGTNINDGVGAYTALAAQGSVPTDMTGGTETRPRNNAVMYIVKYQ